jgi:hypothetical protein
MKTYAVKNYQSLYCMHEEGFQLGRTTEVKGTLSYLLVCHFLTTQNIL